LARQELKRHQKQEKEDHTQTQTLHKTSNFMGAAILVEREIIQ